MVVGYALGNRSDQEDDVSVIGEDDPNVTTFSSAVHVQLSSACSNKCPICSKRLVNKLMIPYSTIKVAKKYRVQGAREIVYSTNYRPDQYSDVRSIFDLWGFPSYVDYLYTVCELGFLEGLIPVIDFDFLKPDEIRKLHEVAALMQVMIVSKKDFYHHKLLKQDLNAIYARRMKNIEWAGKLGFPVRTGFLACKSQSERQRKEWLRFVAGEHEKYGHVHEFIVDGLTEDRSKDFIKKEILTDIQILEVARKARDILPEDIPVMIPLHVFKNPTNYMKLGIQDLGSIYIYPEEAPFKDMDIESVLSEVKKAGLTLQQRFPIRKSFIKSEMYSKKLGQVFDAYRYKIKKEAQAKIKELKS